MIGIQMTGVAQSLFSLDLATIGPAFLLVALTLSIIAMAWWYIAIIAVTLALMWYTKTLIATIMAIFALAGGIAWTALSNWPKPTELAVIATFICLIALCALFILREHTEAFD